MPVRKHKPDDEQAAIGALELELERRQPEPYDMALAAKAEGQLDGLLVKIDHAQIESHNIEFARAILNLRRIVNKHKCTRRQVEDPPCEEPDHWRDVAALRLYLMMTGLPGDISLLPLAYADEEPKQVRQP